jgi:hypothetical protein
MFPERVSECFQNMHPHQFRIKLVEVDLTIADGRFSMATFHVPCSMFDVRYLRQIVIGIDERRSL